MLKVQLLFLFDRFSSLTSRPDVKKRMADAVQDKLEAVSVTTAIQEEILLEMGVAEAFLFWVASYAFCVNLRLLDPRYGILCLGKSNAVYENNRDLMIRFYKGVEEDP